ncbi:fibulin-7-like isoform X2 [Anas acuta]|uniref:fibulin-7-like isoform X2 n=1 Tax=Anas acuta TaxID=28680 RepID=UPI0035C8DCCC
MLLVLLPAWVALCVLQLPLGSTQECLSHQQVLSTVRQMQKLLSAQEAAHLQGTRSLKKQLSALQSRVQRLASKRNETCPQLAVPANGRKLGRSARVGHDVHFVCDAGFRLVGSETRTCRRDRTWGGTQPFCRSIDDCSSNPCANGGTCVDGNQSYTCLCPRGWSGTSCQSPVYTYWVTLSNSSFSRQPRCAEGRPGSRHCSCDTGFQMRAGGVCQDVDECTGSQHNCTHGELCINTFGGHRCVRPKCPPPRHNTSYVKTSSFQCERNPCPMDSRACRLAATSISFHYLPLQANRSVPRVLFKMSTTRFVGDSLRFAIMGGRGQGVFAVRRSDRQTGELVLTSPVVGPATLEVELEMSEFSHKVLLGKHIFKVTAFVSPYEF